MKNDSNISFSKSVFYASAYVPIYMLMVPMNIIQGIYAKHYGLALTTLATIILISRVFDAISDPVIGYYSDWYREKNRYSKTIYCWRRIDGSSMRLLLIYSSK